MKYCLILVAFIASFNRPVAAQERNQEFTLLLSNVGFGALTGGIGAVINKPKATRWHKALVTGFWQGGIGGFLNYGSKKTLYQINRTQNTIFVIPVVILHSAGNSIIENSARQRPFMQYWSLDYGPVRMDFSTNNSSNFKLRLLPRFVYSAISLYNYGKIDWGLSLLSGNLAFRSNRVFHERNQSFMGSSDGRAMTYLTHGVQGANEYEIIAHELIHYFQYREFLIFNTWLEPVAEKWSGAKVKRILSKYIYFDLPYFDLAYALEGYHQYPLYNRNFFEFEAKRFGSNAYVPLK